MLLPEGNKQPSRLEEAMEFLQEILADGPVLSTEVQQEAERQGIADKTLKRARERLEVGATRKGFADGRWRMFLPSDRTGVVRSQEKDSPTEDVQVQNFDLLRESNKLNYE